MSEEKPSISIEQAQKLGDILSQYAPAGWLSLHLVYFTDEKLSKISTWAVTQDDPEHGFDLDDEDANAIEELFSSIETSETSAWNTVIFDVTEEGDFTAAFELQ